MKIGRKRYRRCRDNGRSLRGGGEDKKGRDRENNVEKKSEMRSVMAKKVVKKMLRRRRRGKVEK